MNKTGSKGSKARKKKPFRRVMAALDLPEESGGRTPKLTWLGRSDLLVENHNGILQYGERCVRFFTEEGVLGITGTALKMLELGAHRAYIRGEIRAAEYEIGAES